MATRRRTTKGKPRRRTPARRKGGRTSPARAQHRGGGRARHAPPVESAREVRAQDRGERADATGTVPQPPPALRLAEPPIVEEGTGRSEAVDRDAAELARRIEAQVGSATEALRTGPGSAAERLRAHRDQVEDEARRREEALRHEEERDLPGVATIGFEIVIGALRLARSMATAPLRIGLAFLRRGDADA